MLPQTPSIQHMKTASSQWEEREQGGRCFVVFTIRTRGQQHLLRPVAARYMHDKEVNAYDKEKSSAPEKRSAR